MHRPAAVIALLLVLVLLPGPAVAQPATDLVPALVAALTGPEGDSRIVVLDLDGTSRTLTDGAQDVAPVAAPDGDRAAFVRLAEAGDASGVLGLVDLLTGAVQMTSITVDRTAAIMWADLQTLIATTPDGIVAIRPAFHLVEFIPGTAAGQVALDVRPGPAGDTGAPAPPRVLAWTPPSEAQPLRLLELTGTDAPTVLWTDPEPHYTIAAGAYGPAGSIAFLPTISSSGFGTVQHLHLMDPDGHVVDDAQYGGDGPVNLTSGPHWRPDGGAVLFGGTGTQRFPGLETEPATLLVEGPGEDVDRTLATRPKPEVLLSLGWRPDASAAVAITDGPDGDASLLLVAPDGTLLREVILPGDLADSTPEAANRFPTPDADLLPPIRRVGGDTRSTTAEEVSQATFPADTRAAEPLSEHVVIARADVYADALAGAPLARMLDAPLLLTGPDDLDPSASAEIQRLGATRAVLLGGEAAIRGEVEQDLSRLGVEVERLAGPDRFATAAAVAQRLPASTEVVLVEGDDHDPDRGWPDAVSAGPLAAAATAPLLLVTTDAVPPATAEALADRAPETVTVVGGPTAVSDATAQAAADAADAILRRIAGANRVATSVAVAEAQIAAGTGSAASLWIATATGFADALAAGPAVAADGGVLLLVDDAADAPALTDFLSSTDSRAARLIGGPGAIGSVELSSLLLALGLGGPDARPLDLG